MQHSVVNFSEIKAVDDFRIDAEYWHPIFIQNSELVAPHQKLRDYVDRNIANIKSFPINRDFEYLEISQISLISFEYQTTTVQLSEEPDRAHHLLKAGDVVVSTVRPNRNAIAFIKTDGIVGSSGLAVLRSYNIEAEYLLAFCKTSYFVNCLMRANKASMYPAVSTSDILDTPLFLPSKSFRALIVKIVKKSTLALDKSKQIYAEAQTFLLTKLGLEDWQPEEQLTFIKNFSDTKRAERIDADYFQPKYEKIEQGINKYSNRLNKIPKKIRDEFKQNKTTFEVDPEKLYRYVEIGSVNVATGEIVAEEILGKDLPANAKRVLKKGDIIVSKVRTYRGAITIVQEDGYVGSGAFCVLRENGQINKETLLACLRSKLFLTWSWKPNTGTSYPTLSDNDILDFPIPILPKEKQVEIKQKIDELLNLRKHARDLLDHAKRAVEIAIKQDEQIAIDWLESVVDPEVPTFISTTCALTNNNRM